MKCICLTDTSCFATYKWSTDYVKENKTKHNKYWRHTPDHPYRMLIIGGPGSGKTNVLLNLIENQPDIDKIYLHAKDPYEAKY